MFAMENILLIPMPIKQFKLLIKECLEEHLRKIEPTSSSNEDQQMTQKEAAAFLKISQATIIEWKKKNLLPYHQIPGTNRVFFLKSEILGVTRNNSHLLKN
jgi:hypothetical protein